MVRLDSEIKKKKFSIEHCITFGPGISSYKNYMGMEVMCTADPL